MSRKRKKKNPEIIWWIAGGAGVLLFLGIAVSIPAVRNVFKSIGGEILPPLPPTNKRVLVCYLLDNSGSSKNVKQKIVDNMSAVLKAPGVTAETVIWSYADKETEIYRGINSMQQANRAINEGYVDQPTSKIPKTNLGQALSKVEKEIEKWESASPGGLVLLCIGTDGGSEDYKDSQKVAKRLAAKNVLCFVHGIVVGPGRLPEILNESLRPLEDADRLVPSNENNFDQRVELFKSKVKAAIAATGTNP